MRRAAGDYERAAAYGTDLLAGFAGLKRAELWTSAATHAVLPLIATRPGAALQLAAGIHSHRERFGGWRGGFWLPECAYRPGLECDLAERGVRITCVDQTDQFGRGSLDNLEPVLTDTGVVAVPVDWDTICLVWDMDDGYPTAPAYRDYHRKTRYHLKPWNTTGEPYSRDDALAQAREHAVDFVARALVRSNEVDDGLVVCALDTELLGHWWYEGPQWLEAVTQECERQGLALTHLDDALQKGTGTDLSHTGTVELPVTTWGSPRDLSTWSGPGVEDFAWRARRAELEVLRAGAQASPRAVRELLALQSSDWAFLVHRDLAAAYGHGRAEGHAELLSNELASLGSNAPELRNLAPYATTAPLLA